MMRSSFLQAKGYGYLSESYSKEYYGLVKQLQGISSVTWDEEITDSGVSSTESVTTTTTEEEGRGSKRKLAENTTSSTTSLDNTFTLTEKPRAFTLCAEQLMAKGGLVHPYFSAVVVELLQGLIVTYSMIKRQ